jgi:uncharacterized protein YgiM (DUF1202 family)
MRIVMRGVILSVVVVLALAGVAAPTTTAQAGCTPRYDWTGVHTVQRGETAFRIARRYGLTTGELAGGNCLPDASRIYAGQQLRVPGANPVPGNAYVAESWVRMRSGPGFNYRVVRYLHREPVTVLGRSFDNQWVYVRATNGQEGWVWSQLVVFNGMGITSLPVMQ